MHISVPSTLAVAAAMLIAGAPAAHASLEDTVRDDLEFAEQQLRATATSLPANRYPASTGPTGEWTTTGPGAWTSGFFPGTLWLAYAASADPFWRAQGEARLAALEGQKRDVTGNDQGFKVFGSFGNAYELTGNDAYRRVVLRAAESLASRYSPVVGATRSWGKPSSPDFTVIVDNLMNLELLFWASKHGGDPALYAMALSHALKTMRNHVRSDGSTYHVVDFDPQTGGVKRKRTRQGYSRDSTWSRGQAWAVYGFTMAYRETGDGRLLGSARRVADWFVAHLPPDGVPYWDFDAPGIPDTPRDSSAAAIAASGLLELAALEPEAGRAAGYRTAADSMIATLSADPYLARDEATQAILLHGTQDKPKGDFDTGLAFGDYYFVEALLRHISPPSPPDSPALEVTATKRGRRVHGARADGLRATVSSEEPGRVRAALLFRGAAARRLDLSGAGVIGHGRARLEEAGEVGLRVRIARRAAKHLRDLNRVPVTLSVVLRTDGGASATTASLRL